METKLYYVIKPTTHNRRKATYGDSLELTESQARPLRHGGFVTLDKVIAGRISELILENEKLKSTSKENKNIGITATDKEVQA